MPASRTAEPLSVPLQVKITKRMQKEIHDTCVRLRRPKASFLRAAIQRALDRQAVQ